MLQESSHPSNIVNDMVREMMADANIHSQAFNGFEVTKFTRGEQQVRSADQAVGESTSDGDNNE